MSNVKDFPESPSRRLGLTDKDTKHAEEIEHMLEDAFGAEAFDRDGELMMLLLLLVAQLRRRVDALERENARNGRDFR